MALGLQPQHAYSTARLLTQLSDEICDFANLRSHDVSWYRNRAFVLELYATTELFMLTDDSQGCADTWQV